MPSASSALSSVNRCLGGPVAWAKVSERYKWGWGEGRWRGERVGGGRGKSRDRCRGGAVPFALQLSVSPGSATVVREWRGGREVVGERGRAGRSREEGEGESGSTTAPVERRRGSRGGVPTPCLPRHLACYAAADASYTGC